MQPMFFQHLAHLLGFFALRIRAHAHAHLVAGFFGVCLEAQFFQPVCFLPCGIGIGIGADLCDEAFAASRLVHVVLGFRVLRFNSLGFRLFIGMYLALRFSMGIAC